MDALWKAPTFWRGITVVLILGLATFTAEVETTLQIANIARFALAIAVTIAYWAPFFEAVRARMPDYAHHLVLGIQMSWLSDAALGACAGLFWWHGRPEWWVHHWLGRLPAIFISWGRRWRDPAHHRT